jgi:mRNA degradation ribonuclease J1/J2
MSSDGILIISIVIAEGMLLALPGVSSRGFIGMKEEKIHDLVRNEANERIKKHLSEKQSLEGIKSIVVKSINKYIYKLTKRNPLIIVEIMEV